MLCLQRLLLAALLLSPLSSAQAASPQLNEALIYHTYFSSMMEVQRLLNQGADPNAIDKNGWSALAIASDRNDGHATMIASALLDKGANPNIGKQGNYPIFNAIKNKNRSLVALLISHDVNLRAMNGKRQSVLAVAKEINDPTILYYLDKRTFEEEQAKRYLYSALRQHQLTKVIFQANCEIQYWGFYLKSEQDTGIDKAAINARIQESASLAGKKMAAGMAYFPAFQNGKVKQIADQVRNAVFVELDSLISNRNRRQNGVGTEADMQKRCGKILKSMR
jgi:hypothetical protein